jgi:glyoxylase-like metal-dependent hydrolase (beta-lactamase superfamily II)
MILVALELRASESISRNNVMIMKKSSVALVTAISPKRKVIAFIFAAALTTGLSSSQDELPKIEVTRLATHLYKFHHGVNNCVVSIGPDGILLSDSAPETFAQAMKSALIKFGTDDIQYIINTHWHHDHSGGNLLFGKEAIIIAHHSVRGHLLEEQEISLFGEKFKAYPEYACPDLTISTNTKIYFNGEEIEVTPLPHGHTEGDVVVYFRNANVLHVGDLYVSGHFPSIDFDHGGDVEQLADNLETIIAMMPPDATIVSGHLADATLNDIEEYVVMLKTTTRIVRDGLQKGKTSAEMQEENILEDWKDWGAHVSCDMWIETIVRCLDADKKG